MRPGARGLSIVIDPKINLDTNHLLAKEGRSKGLRVDMCTCA